MLIDAKTMPIWVMVALSSLFGFGCDNHTTGSTIPPMDYPSELTVPNQPKILGTTTIEFIETTSDPTLRFARIVFSAGAPDGYVVQNPVTIPEADIVRFASGERIVLPTSGAQAHFGYGTRGSNADGYPQDEITWRNVIAVQLTSPEEGEVAVHLELGATYDDDGVVVSQNLDSGRIVGRADFTCLPKSGVADPLFNVDAFCAGLWDAVGGLSRYSEAFAAR